MRLGSALAGRAFAAVERTFGERVRIQPMEIGGYTISPPDADRPIKETRAVVAFTPSTSRPKGMGGRDDGSGMRLGLRRGVIWLRPEAIEALCYTIKIGDAVLLIDRPGCPRYQVTSPPTPSDRGDYAVDIVLER